MVELKCKYCNQIFTGINKEQVESQLAVHLVTKHKDLVEIKEVKK